MSEETLARLYKRESNPGSSATKAPQSGRTSSSSNSLENSRAIPLVATVLEDFSFHPKIDPKSEQHARKWASVPVEQRLFYKETLKREQRMKVRRLEREQRAA